MAYPSKSQIAAAGKVLAAASPSDDDVSAALEILAIWRAAHQEPLESIAFDAVQASQDIPDSIVVTRLKRHDTIIRKLRRTDANFKLSALDDIGGCRVIVPDITSVRRVEERLCAVNGFWKRKDYIEEPRMSGYRSFHLLHRRNSETFGYSSLRIETQIRTVLQHAWSTAVESYDVIERSGLKFGEASYGAKRFFALAAQVIANEESQNSVPGVTKEMDALVSELLQIDHELHVLQKLFAFSGSFELANEEKDFAGAESLLIGIDYGSNMSWVTPLDDSRAAADEYTKAERKKEDGQDVLLVSVSSFEDLKAAYPNYFSDVNQFLSVMYPYLVRS